VLFIQIAVLYVMLADVLVIKLAKAFFAVRVSEVYSFKLAADGCIACTAEAWSLMIVYHDKLLLIITCMVRVVKADFRMTVLWVDLAVRNANFSCEVGSRYLDYDDDDGDDDGSRLR